MRTMYIVDKRKPNKILKINSLSQIKVVDYDEENVARPDERYATDRDEEKNQGLH